MTSLTTSGAFYLIEKALKIPQNVLTPFITNYFESGIMDALTDPKEFVDSMYYSLQYYAKNPNFNYIVDISDKNTVDTLKSLVTGMTKGQFDAKISRGLMEEMIAQVGGSCNGYDTNLITNMQWDAIYHMFF